MTVDPTKNVIALVKAETKRQDDLREAQRRHLASDMAWVLEALRAHERHTDELRKLEASRIDALRAGDIQAANLARQAADARAATLAQQVDNTAIASRAAMDAAADAIRTQVTEPLRAQIAQLQETRSEGKGVQAQVTEKRSGAADARQLIGSITGVLALIVAAVVAARNGG